METPEPTMERGRGGGSCSPTVKVESAEYDPEVAAVAAHAWLEAAVDGTDREVMPWVVVSQLLRDPGFLPGSRPVQLLPSGKLEVLPRAHRIFKEIRQNERRFGKRRKGNVDVWHSAGGASSRRGLPQHAPVVYRKYGAVKIARGPQDGGSSGAALVATFNFHEYMLADPPAGAEHVRLFHIFATRKKDKEKDKGKTGNVGDGRARIKTEKDKGKTGNVGDGRARMKTSSTLNLSAPGGSGIRKLSFMSFQKLGRPVGRFTELSTGGMQLESIGGDVAEWHRLADLEEGTLDEGDLISLIDSEVTRVTSDNSGMLGVVSHKAMVEGSAPTDTRRHVRIAYVGRVPVRVRGPIECGDYITPSGRNDGTGVKATSFHQRTVGCVVALGVSPCSAEDVWQVEIVAMPPQTSHRPACGLLGTYSRRLFAALCMVGLLCLCGRTLWSTPSQNNVEQLSVTSAHSALSCGREGWDTVRTACSEELSRFYRQEGTSGAGTFGEGGLVNELVERGLLDDGNAIAENLNLGSVVPIGETCASNHECPDLLRRYLDSCPLAPRNASGSVLLKIGPKTTASHMDILFARQCLTRRFPDLLKPSSIVVQPLSAPDVAVGSKKPMPLAAVPGADACTASSLGLPPLSTVCATCASTGPCSLRRRPEDYASLMTACGYDEMPFATGPPELAAAQCPTRNGCNNESYVVIPRWSTPYVIGDMVNIVRFEYRISLAELTCAPDELQSSCTCYAKVSKCAQAMDQVLQILARHPECTIAATRATEDAKRGETSEFPPPSALALMLAASRGDRLLQVLP